MIIVSGQILGINEEVMVSVQLPEFTVDDIKVFIGEVVCDLVYIVFLFQKSKGLTAKTVRKQALLKFFTSRTTKRTTGSPRLPPSIRSPLSITVLFSKQFKSQWL